MSLLLFRNDATLLGRALSNFEADKSAVYALAQGAVNAELFTIPLYIGARTNRWRGYFVGVGREHSCFS